MICVLCASSPAAQPAPPAAAVRAPLALEPVLLDRWGFDADKVQALPSEKREQLRQELTDLELGRQRKLELLKKAAPDDWSSYVDAKGLLTPAGEKKVADYLATLVDKPLLVPAKITEFSRADGKPLTPEDYARAQSVLDRMWDGVAGRSGKDLGSEVVVDARVRNETVYSMTLSNPRTGLSVEVGQLYVDGRHPQAESSWYGNLVGAWDSKPDSWVDYRVKAQLGYVDLRARWFADGPDPRVQRVFDLAKNLGVPAAQANQAAGYVTYDDPYKAHGLIVGSLLTELGRAYNLAGPVDITWTAANLTKVLWLAPNTAFDETVGLRVKLASGLFVGVFGGATQNISPVGTQLLQEALQTQTISPGFNLENAPHAALAAWGQVPGVSDLQFSVSASQRWNHDTTVRQAEASLTTMLYEHPLSLRGVYSRETGAAIEFDRETVRAQLDYKFSEHADAYLAYERDRILYGNAKVDSDAFMAGLNIEFGPSARLTIDQLMGGRYNGTESPLKPAFQDTLTQINKSLTAGVGVIDQAAKLYDGIRGDLTPAQLESGLNALSLALSRLDPATEAQLLAQLQGRSLTDAQKTFIDQLWLRTVSPNSSAYAATQAKLLAALGPIAKIDDAEAYWKAHRGEIKELIGLLTNESVWDAALIQAARAQLLTALDKLGKVKIPVLGHDVTIQVDASAALAAANILQSRLSPVAPIKEGQIDPVLLRTAGQALGLQGNQITEQAIVGQLFTQADAALKAQLAQRLTPLLNQLGNQSGRALAGQVLAALPPAAAAMLTQRYGADLSGLIPAGANTQQLRDLLLNRLPNEVTAWMEAKYGPELARSLAAMTTWAGELIRREINMTLIQLLLASEELNRLTVDGGKKLDDLDLRFALRSFSMLDARGKDDARQRLKDVTAKLAEETGREEAQLVGRVTSQGRAQLRSLQLDPSWPDGLRVEVADASLAPILSFYGDSEFFALLGRVKDQYLKKNKKTLTVTFTFEPSRDGKGGPFGSGTSIRTGRDGAIEFLLTRPRDPGDAAFRLSSLETYL